MKERIVYDEVLAADSRAVAKLFDIPFRILSLFQLEGFISRGVITSGQWEMLNMIRCMMWDNRRVIRAMLANLPKVERRRLVDVCEKSAIERIVYTDFLRIKLVGRGIMNDERLITFNHYEKYITWRHPEIHHLLTPNIFYRQRKSAEARIRYCRQHGTLSQLITDLGLKILADGTVVNPWIQLPDTTNTFSGQNIFYD